MLDDLRRAERLEGAGDRRAEVGMAPRHPLHVRLVDHRLRPRPLRRPVGAPGVRRHHDPALGHRPRAVAPVEREVRPRMADAIAVERVVPAQLALKRPRVGVEQQLVRVEPVPGLGRVRPVRAEPVELPRPQVGKVAVPDLVGELRQRDPVGLLPPGRIEQAELDAGRIRGEDRDVDPRSVPGGAEWKRQTCRDPVACGHQHTSLAGIGRSPSAIIARNAGSAQPFPRGTSRWRTFRPQRPRIARTYCWVSA